MLRAVVPLLLTMIWFAPSALPAAEPERVADALPRGVATPTLTDILSCPDIPQRRGIGPQSKRQQGEMPAVVQRPDAFLHWSRVLVVQTPVLGPSAESAPTPGAVSAAGPPLVSATAAVRCVQLCRLLL